VLSCGRDGLQLGLLGLRGGLTLDGALLFETDVAAGKSFLSRRKGNCRRANRLLGGRLENWQVSVLMSGWESLADGQPRASKGILRPGSAPTLPAEHASKHTNSAAQHNDNDTLCPASTRLTDLTYAWIACHRLPLRNAFLAAAVPSCNRC